MMGLVTERYKWEFVGHSEVAFSGAGHDNIFKFEKTVKIPMTEHLKGLKNRVRRCDLLREFDLQDGLSAWLAL